MKTHNSTNGEENDPDILQLLDELDTDWVKLWGRATNKKRSTKKELKLNVILPKKAIQQSKLQSNLL